MKALGGLVLAVALVLALFWIFQRRLIYLPTTSPPASGTSDRTFEEVSYRTDDGLRLEAWFVPADQDPVATVVVFPGNAGHRAFRLPLAEALAARGFATLLVDYRGYGGNPGSPTEPGLMADARAAVDYVEQRSDVDQIVYFGESLGAGVATALAAIRPPAALVLRSPFTSLADIGAHHYPWLPVSVLLRDRFPTVNTIRNIDVPVLVVAGSTDRIVPSDQSRQVYEAAGGDKRLVIVEGAGHNDFAMLAGDELIEETVSFVELALASAP